MSTVTGRSRSLFTGRGEPDWWKLERAFRELHSLSLAAELTALYRTAARFVVFSYDVSGAVAIEDPLAAGELLRPDLADAWWVRVAPELARLKVDAGDGDDFGREVVLLERQRAKVFAAARAAGLFWLDTVRLLGKEEARQGVKARR